MRAERARKYLINRRGMQLKEIDIIDGGYREQFEIELYLLPRDVDPPTPYPTVVPSEAQMIKNDNVGANDSRSSRSPRKRYQRCQ
jgi:hypothetical protein